MMRVNLAYCGSSTKLTTLVMAMISSIPGGGVSSRSPKLRLSRPPLSPPMSAASGLASADLPAPLLSNSLAKAAKSFLASSGSTSIPNRRPSVPSTSTGPPPATLKARESLSE
jgi:hypothetical protein